MEEMQDTTAQVVCQGQKKNLLDSVKGFVEKRKKLLIIIAAALVFAAVVGIVLYNLSPGQIAVKYAEAYYFDDIVKENKYTAYDLYEYLMGDSDEEEYFESKSDQYDEEIENWKDLSRVLRERAEEQLTDRYGEYKLTIEVTRTKDMSMRKLESEYASRLQYLEDKGVLDRDDLSDAMIVTARGKIKGEDETQRLTFDVVMVKKGILWKVLTIK